MGSNKHLKEKAISLRKEGKSYSEILKILKIKSKGTLSLWFKNIELSDKSKKLLEKNNIIAHKHGLFKANNNRKVKIDKENDKAFKQGQGLIKSISLRELIIIGASLYWAEGYKSEKTTNTPLDFCNSDPQMIIVYMKFIRKILKIPEEKIRAGIHIYESINSDEARDYWARITNLPKDRFFIVIQISKNNKNKKWINKLPYGTLVIKINSRIQFNKVKGMIAGIAQNIKGNS